MWLRRDVDEARGLIAGFDLDPQLADDLIVALALRLRGEGRDVCVVTADGGLEMKLEDRGIPVIVPDDRLRLQPEPDPERLRAERAERELRAQRDSLPGLVVSWRRSAPLTRQAGLGDSDGYVEEALCDFYITSLTNIKTAY